MKKGRSNMKTSPRVCVTYVVAALAVLLVSGCAGTRVNNVVSAHDVTLPAPRTIAVQTRVELAHAPRHESREVQLEAADQAGKALNASLEASLRARHLTVVSSDQHPDILLDNRIVDVRRGKRALRLFVGYGAGRAELEVDSNLQFPRGRQPQISLLSFQAKSTTGGMPGDAISGSIKSLVKDGLEVQVKDTAKLIDGQLEQFFLAQGWPYPHPSSISSVRQPKAPFQVANR